MDAIEALGYVEAWRHLHPDEREYTWYSNKGNGYQVDLAYLSPVLVGRLLAAEYAHQERAAGHSDHSPLVVDLAVR